MDPYRRLALYTAPQMAAQAFRNERVHNQLTGRKPSSVAASCWSLDASDVRAGVGQKLRVSAAWVARHRAEARAKVVATPKRSYKWYFLTEDNHWAPLDAKEMNKLDQCYESEYAHLLPRLRSRLLFLTLCVF